MEIESETLIEIANTLEITVEQIFNIFVEAQPVLATISTVLITLFIIISLYLIRFFSNKATDGDYSDDDGIIIRVFGPIITIFIMVPIFIKINYILVRILLPEYSAIRELIDIIGI